MPNPDHRGLLEDIDRLRSIFDDIRDLAQQQTTAQTLTKTGLDRLSGDAGQLSTEIGRLAVAIDNLLASTRQGASTLDYAAGVDQRLRDLSSSAENGLMTLYDAAEGSLKAALLESAANLRRLADELSEEVRLAMTDITDSIPAASTVLRDEIDRSIDLLRSTVNDAKDELDRASDLVSTELARQISNISTVVPRSAQNVEDEVRKATDGLRTVTTEAIRAVESLRVASLGPVEEARRTAAELERALRPLVADSDGIQSQMRTIKQSSKSIAETAKQMATIEASAERARRDLSAISAQLDTAKRVVGLRRHISTAGPSLTTVVILSVALLSPTLIEGLVVVAGGVIVLASGLTLERLLAPSKVAKMFRKAPEKQTASPHRSRLGR